MTDIPSATSGGDSGIPTSARPRSEAGLAYWKERLAGAPPVLALPTDRPRPAAPRHRGEMVGLRVPRELTERLDRVSRDHGVTPFMTLLAVFQLMLGRWARVQDVSVGTTAADPAGLFVNTLVLRSRWEDDPTFAQLLERVREGTLGAYDHQDVPFEQVVEVVRPPHDASHAPLFQVMMAMQNIPASRVAAFDLTLVWKDVPPASGELCGSLVYDVDLFERGTADRMAAHFTALLASALADPGARVSLLAHTTSEERALLAGWGTEGGELRTQSVVEAFHEQADATPDAVALVFEAETLTYAELRDRSQRLTQMLTDRGVEPESVIALAMDRSASLYVAMLAVLTAGAAYLPLDPGQPQARLGFMVENSKACLVLADREVSFAGPVPVVDIDTLSEECAVNRHGPVRTLHAVRSHHPDTRACVLYTSGSTGVPKGVEITHGGIVRLVCDAAYLGFDSSDVVAQAANVSFDAATFEIWGALLNGARLVAIPKDAALSPELLGARIVEYGVTVLFLTTSLFHLCVDAAPALFAPLRSVFFGGEAADARRVAALLRAVPGLRLVNCYGPTEGTTLVSSYDAVDVEPDAARVPIGRPVAQTRLYVLDGSGRMTGVGVPGELHIGDRGLARGYAGRPDLTAERFVPSPFGVGERLYRTGDVARWREDGVLEYLGRMDTQVKIRGIRIEPDEIASTLATCPGVRTAVVDVQGDGEARTLVAYVVPVDAPLDRRTMRAHLAERLPEAMVPAWYVTLPELPVTPNGKVDLRALPAPLDGDGMRATTYVPPSGAAQELVAQVWQEVLGVGVVSAHDHFFELGGHSLLATQVVSRIAGRLGVELGIRDLFEAPTVAALAARVTAARRAHTEPVTVTGEGPHRLSFAQQRLWFLDRLNPGSPLYNVPLVLAIEGPLEVSALGESLRALVQRHAALRTRLVGEEDDLRQIVDGQAQASLVVDDLRQLPQADREREARALAQHEAELPFDLAAGPLLRARLVRLGEERFELLVTMHHAVSDGWSVGVLIRDLGALYTSAVSGEDVALPQLPVQYADYAHWQRRFLGGGTREDQLAYWKERLAGAPPLLELPTDRPRPPVPRFAGEVFPLCLSPELTERLDRVSRDHGVTRFMTLLAAFQLMLGRYAGVQDVSVGSPTSGRTFPEVEDLIGFFVNTLVLRTRWEDDPTFAQLLERVREGTLGAHDHQDVPFEQVVEVVRPPRDASHTPLFQVMMAMQNVPVGTDAMEGLSVSIRESASRIAKFDLTVAWDEAPPAAGGLRGSVEYDTDLFDQATVERMTGHYLTLLESALADPGARVSRLAMVSDTEIAALVPATADAAPTGAATLHGLFEAAARRWADRPALRQGNDSLTYAELDARSNAIGAYLRARGVEAGSTVVVSMDRSLAWPAALLGILKAGAAYVPVDVRTPRDRYQHVLGDCGAVLVLGSRTGGPPPSGQVPFVAVEDVLDGTAGGSTQVPSADSLPSELAYILYTSGTTGRPKGVCVSHGNLVHTLGAVAECYGLEPDDRVLQFAALTFDVAAEELFATLLSGATVVIPPAGPPPGIEELTAMARQERLTVLNLPASYWHEWVSVLAEHPPAACPSLRLVVVGSERVDEGKLAAWHAVAPAHIRWLNAYGPTETTITATVHEPTVLGALAPPRTPGGATVPIGRPLRGVHAYVLDSALRPVPQGVAGDLYLAGAGVSRGYLGDPGRSACFFLPDPWGEPGERMYATGDRARRGQGGVLEFLGRGDDQIKLRGFRIELGEIEAALASHPGVRDAVAVLREDTPGRPLLVGYVALTGEASAAELRAHLENRLPGYMVPGAIVVLDQLPHGERGKVDRRALPAPEPASEPSGNGDAPVGELEGTIAAVWREVLQLDEVAADKNFFDLGGHSLLVVRVQGRLAQRLGRKIPVADLFRFPTVRGLARHFAASDGAVADSGSGGRRRAAARKMRSGVRAPRRQAK
ncbi:amino acid adenylation domain-containing protein [Streptomyces sp. NPDC006475]|uniref:amino acid adenylation domain-containing protein n=1 Tax=Streptomyces sp. NPDC006475 TaxID=3155719 RepID=UPI0033A0CB09